MAIINSLYLYCTGWKATQQTYQYCRNPLHHHKKLFNPRQRGSNSVRLLSGPNAKSNNRSIYGCNMRNNSHTDNTGNSKKSKTVNSSYSTSIMNCEQDSFRDIKLCSNYSENTKFGLMKIIRTCNLMSFLLNEKQMCSKHFELIKLFIEQLQTIIEHLEKDIDNTLKNLVNFSIDIFSEKIVTKGSKYLKTIINCSECNEKSFIDSPLMKHFNNESFSTEHCDHYYNSTKLGQSKSQNHTLDDNKIKSSSNCRTNRFWSHLLSHTKIDCHQMADVTYSDTSFQFYPTNVYLNPYHHCLLTHVHYLYSVPPTTCLPLHPPHPHRHYCHLYLHHIHIRLVGEQKIPLCLFHSKCHMRDSPVHGYSQQYLQRNKQSEIENCNINLNEIYPHSVSRRPSVRDILNQRKNDHTLCEKKQQQDKQQIHLFDQSSKNYTDDNIAKSIKTNFYISNGHINCHHSNLCFSHSDYLFSENNLNMGVVPPPNLNPFAS
ncbi:LOW QUALITY PROTEIN: hypothetical protein Smp_126290 [Schistosoma mansoni]|uniref:hypothetical protein n=1 Tax=Schistosoma mansoni TaxID=6183 RepID=UPI00022DBEB3|nr:LOW QUALITY PROTEIN: hypothetical protein Smp_126290 [Schistosoma mansoni]|eukprot:XP_018653965.1 LOW QUALITY PROTEIN: hypothetical protein Smp_126290 [Schistosoma mansoni]